jgi:hypothetical protein
VLEEAGAVGETARPEWYKIAAPAGEFRWIHADFLTASPPEGRPAGPSAPPADSVDATDSDDSNDRRGPAPNVAGWNARIRHGRLDRAKADHGVDLASGEQPAAAAPAPAAMAEAPGASSSAQSPAPPEALPEDDPLAAELVVPEKEPGAATLDDVELDLSMMVAGDPSRWRLTPLRRKVEQVVSDSPSPAVRGRGRALLSKLGRFEDIQSRHFALLGISRTQAGPDPSRAAPTGRESPFDGQGWLRQVVSRKPGAPQFALLNAAGEVTCFVTAAPGTNLRPYLGKQVGLVGTRGYMPEFKARHVTARRVTLLDPPKWR